MYDTLSGRTYYLPNLLIKIKKRQIDLNRAENTDSAGLQFNKIGCDQNKKMCC